jgi:hypothetical protein
VANVEEMMEKGGVFQLCQATIVEGVMFLKKKQTTWMTSRPGRSVKSGKKDELLTLLPTEDVDDYQDPRNYSCCNTSKMCVRWTVGILALISLIIIAVIGVIAYQSTQYTIAIQRNTIVGASNTVNGVLTGLVSFDEGTRSISWNLFLQNSTWVSFSGLTLGIFGPITTSPGVLYVPLCGGATGVVCVANATATQYLPQGYSLESYIVTVRQFPMWYELKLCDQFDNCYVAPLGFSAGAP